MFAPEREPGFSARRSRIIGLVVAAIALVFIGTQLWPGLSRIQHQQAQIRTESTRLTLLQGKLGKVRRAPSQERQGQAANKDRQARTALDVLAGLEAEWHESISFLRIDGDIAKGRLRLQVLATSREALFRFVERMKVRFGDDVFLERHGLTTTPRDGWVVSASMTVGWK